MANVAAGKPVAETYAPKEGCACKKGCNSHECPCYVVVADCGDSCTCSACLNGGKKRAQAPRRRRPACRCKGRAGCTVKRCPATRREAAARAAPAHARSRRKWVERMCQGFFRSKDISTARPVESFSSDLEMAKMVQADSRRIRKLQIGFRKISQVELSVTRISTGAQFSDSYSGVSQ